MKKRFVPLVLVFILILSLRANAAEPRANLVYPKLSFENTTANCSVTITAPGKEIKATMNLWYGNRLIDSWSGTATSALFISGSAGAIKGEEYVLRVSGTIGGVAFTAESVSGIC